jgi:hypothetical protein
MKTTQQIYEEMTELLEQARGIIDVVRSATNKSDY